MGWLTGPRDSKTVGSAAFLSSILAGGAADDALYPEPSFASHASVGFARNELVYACIMEKATSLPEAPLRVYAGDGLGEPREAHPLRLLLSNPNPLLTEFELIELTSIHLDLAGNAFWEIVLDRAGRPVELWPLRPDRVRIRPQRDGRHLYSYVLGETRDVDLGTNVIHFKLPNAADPYIGQAPLRPGLRAVALDNEATDFVKALLQNRAVPGTVIETEQRIDEALAARLTAKWMERFGGNRRGGPAFLQQGMKVHQLGLNLSELEFPDLRQISETRICMVFGVPPILIGAKAGLDRSTFANYGEARTSFWEETLMPLQQRLQQTITKKLMPLIEGPRPRRTTLRFDNSNVRALRESEGRRWELATNALRAGAITVTQFARQVGLPIPDGGDVYLRPAGVIPTDAAGNPVAEATTEPPPLDDEDQGVTEQTSHAPSLRVKANVNRQAQRKRFARAISEFVTTQRDTVLADIRRSKSVPCLAAKAWDATRWDQALADILRTHMLQIAHTAALAVDRDAEASDMDAYITAAAANTATAWNEATHAQVTEAAGQEDSATTLAETFALAAGSRAVLLAATLATEMSGFGSVDTAKRIGHGYKTWRTTSSNPRSAHARLNGETVPIGKRFSNRARWPGDAVLDDDERANCECDVTFNKEPPR